MNKIFLVLCFFPYASLGQIQDLSEPIYDDIDKQIKYIKKFKHWTHFIDHFETKEQVINFFGHLNYDENDAEKKYDCVDFGGSRYYSPASSSTKGNISYNSSSNSFDYNSSTTSYDAISGRTSYWFCFEFEHLGWFSSSDVNGGKLYSKYSDNIKNWETSIDMKYVSNRKFRKFIKKYYSEPKKGEYQYKRKKEQWWD